VAAVLTDCADRPHGAEGEHGDERGRQQGGDEEAHALGRASIAAFAAMFTRASV
jgi:hypothetical protein